MFINSVSSIKRILESNKKDQDYSSQSLIAPGGQTSAQLPQC